MFVRELTSDADYFVSNQDFASVKYTGSSVIYTFDIYGKLLQALIDGHDNIKVQIVKKFSSKFKYFVGDSQEEVELSNIGFVTRTKSELQADIAEATLAEKVVEIASLLPDSIVSDIGSGKITSKNYVDFLPEVELVKTSKSGVKSARMRNFDSKDAGQSARTLFSSTGIYPGRVGEVTFPSEKISFEADGTSRKQLTPTTKKLLSNIDFFDYYNNFCVKPTATKIRKVVSSAKTEYQKFTTDIELSLEDYELTDLTTYEDLNLRVVLVDDDIDVSAETFKFKNSILFEEATSGARKIEKELIVSEANDVLPDVVRVTNRENYSVEISVIEYCDTGKGIEKNLLGIEVLDENQTVDFAATKIYFDNSESRSYAVVANKYIPGVAGVSNVLGFLSPPQCNVKPKQKEKFSIGILPDGEQNNSVRLSITGLTSPDETVLVYKRPVGFGEKELVGKIRYGRNALTLQNLQPGEAYVFDAELQTNGASKLSFASVGYIVSTQRGTEKLTVTLTDKKTSGSGNDVKHSFKIVESISGTPASSFLSAVNKSGEAGNYSAEIEGQKQDTTIITSYTVIRANVESGEMQYLGEHTAGKKLTFGFPPGYAAGAYDSDATYEYYVAPKSVFASALSYRTTVEETDVFTGKTYSYSYKKWRDENYSRSEVLPTYSEVLRDDIAFAFLNLPPGTIETTTFSRKVTNGKITRLRAVSKDHLDCTFISWNFTGDMSNVLHFVVFADYNGFKAPVGTAVPDQQQGIDSVVTYCDDTLGNVAGEVNYSIVPFLKTCQFGQESRIVKVKSTKNPPSAALRN